MVRAKLTLKTSLKTIQWGKQMRKLGLLSVDIWVSVAACALALGCEKGGDQGVRIGSEVQQEELPRVEVKLPPSPSFKKQHAPEVYPDQSLSVYGLRKNMEDHLDKAVKVKAYVIEVYECPPCPKGTECKPCDQPHFWIADTPNESRDKALMVTDYLTDPKMKKKIELEAGQQYVFSGRFAKSSGTGFSSSEGLLVYAEHSPVGEAAPQ